MWETNNALQNYLHSFVYVYPIFHISKGTTMYFIGTECDRPIQSSEMIGN